MFFQQLKDKLVGRKIDDNLMDEIKVEVREFIDDLDLPPAPTPKVNVSIDKQEGMVSIWLSDEDRLG